MADYSSWGERNEQSRVTGTVSAVGGASDTPPIYLFKENCFVMVVCDQKKYFPVALALEDFSSGRFCLIGGAVDGVS